MKGISTIIATIMLVVITIGLISTAYLFVGGVMTGQISKVISLVDAKAHKVIVRNDGTATISSDEIGISVNGQEVEIVNPQEIKPKDTVTLRFIPPELEMKSAKINVLGASNTLSYTTDIVPHESKATSGTVGLWHFNGDTDDKTGNNDGTRQGNPQWVTGKFGSALEFDGNDYVDLGSSAIASNQAEFTVSLWYNTTSSEFLTLYGEGNSTDITHFLWIYVDGPGGVGGYVYDGSYYGGTYSTTQTVDDGKWHHVAYVKRASNDYELYFDGDFVANDTTDVSEPTIDDVRIGGINYGTNAGGNYYFFTGTIDEVKIWNRALSHEEILDSMYG